MLTTSLSPFTRIGRLQNTRPTLVSRLPFQYRVVNNLWNNSVIPNLVDLASPIAGNSFKRAAEGIMS